MNIELTGENENKIRFVDNYGDSYDAEVSYNMDIKELRFRSDYTDVELHIPIALINKINKMEV